MVGMSESGINSVAMLCHAANCGIRDATEGTRPATWQLELESIREATRRGVVFRLSHPDATPADTHAAWVSSRLADGWQYGPVRDSNAKVHPCLVPYAELPSSEKVKDYVFMAIIDAASEAGIV